MNFTPSCSASTQARRSKLDEVATELRDEMVKELQERGE
jgi:hypothetical protein